MNDVAKIAVDLAGDVLRIAQVGGGRNSRVYRVETATGTYALKLYPTDSQDRLGVETTVLRWMDYHEFNIVPRVLAADGERHAVLLSWIEGEPVHDVGEREVEQACKFLGMLHALRWCPAVTSDQLAAEACLSVGEIERQLRTRLNSLTSLDDPSLKAILEHIEREIRFDYKTEALLRSDRSQVPSDFGFQNAIRRPDGQLSFIDFEYFGWDDPVKLIADLLLHPGHTLNDEARASLRSGARDIYGPRFERRLTMLFPLFKLRWALILLNEFLPDRWRGRTLAGETASWTDAKERQLAAAQRMLNQHA